MGGASTDRLVAALRQIRAVDADDRDLGRRLLEVVVSATDSSAATLRHPMSESAEIRVGLSAGDDAVRLDRRFAARFGVAILTVERPADRPFDEDDALFLEALVGEVVLRIEQARAEVDATRLRRQVALLRTLSRTSGTAPLPFALADQAASELLRTFAGAHVLVHVTSKASLELVARHTEAGNGFDDAPDWIRVVPLDGPSSMAVAARAKVNVSRPVHEIVEDRARAAVEGMGIRHLLVVPLSFEDVVLGTLTVAHRKDEPWDAESLPLLESVAAHLGEKLAHARVLEAERRRADDLGFINELASQLSHLELSRVLSTTASALARELEVGRANVLLLDAPNGVFKGVACAGEIATDVSIPIATGVVGAYALRTLAPIVIDDAQNDSRTNREFVRRTGARSMMAVPIVARGEGIGVIVLIECLRTRNFTENEVARVVAVANVIAPAVANAKMFEDLRQSYEALAKAQADLVTHERLAALGELSAVIAHEVRNPVAIIYNSLSELRRHAPPSWHAPEPEELLRIIGEETMRLNRIVGDLLDFVRPYDAHPRHVELDVVVYGAVEAARRVAPEPAVEIRTECLSRSLFLDGTMLQQALLNLIVNAIQATPEGKAVSVRADVVPGADGESLRCEVADEGLGLDEATSARIFQPFFTTKATGTGLGLALVRRLTDALNGSVVPANRPTGGAIFTLTIPLPAALRVLE